MSSTSHFRHHLVAYGAHPDDVEFCCGGLMILMAEKGYKTGVVDLTWAEMSTNGDVETRKLEAARASELLGLTTRENLSLPNSWLDPHHRDEANPELSQVALIVDSLRRLRPEIVAVPYQVERHPDHEATSSLVDRALFFANTEKFPAKSGEPRFAPRQVIYYQMRFPFTPSFVVDVSSVFAKKMAAIEAYSSQVSGGLNSKPTLLNSPQNLTMFEAKDRYCGAMIGSTHGEPYLIKNALSIKDPVRFFQENHDSPPLFFPPQR